MVSARRVLLTTSGRRKTFVTGIWVRVRRSNRVSRPRISKNTFIVQKNAIPSDRDEIGRFRAGKTAIRRHVENVYVFKYFHDGDGHAFGSDATIG